MRSRKTRMILAAVVVMCATTPAARSALTCPLVPVHLESRSVGLTLPLRVDRRSEAGQTCLERDPRASPSLSTHISRIIVRACTALAVR